MRPGTATAQCFPIAVCNLCHEAISAPALPGLSAIVLKLKSLSLLLLFLRALYDFYCAITRAHFITSQRKLSVLLEARLRQVNRGALALQLAMTLLMQSNFNTTLGVLDKRC